MRFLLRCGLSKSRLVWMLVGIICILLSVSISVQARPVQQRYASARSIKKSEWANKLINVALNKDGSSLAIAGVDNDLLIYDPFTLTETNRLVGHTDETIAVDWSSSGLIASGGKDKTVQIWDADFNPILILPKHDDWVVAVAWSPDGNLLATLDEVSEYEYAQGPWATKGSLRIWNIHAGGQLLATFSPIKDAVRSIEWSIDGTKIATAGNRQSYGISIWNVVTGKLDRQLVGIGIDGMVTSFGWSKDNTEFAVGSIQGYTQIWTANDGSLLAEWKEEKAISALVWRPDGRVTIANYDSDILVWNPTADVMATLTNNQTENEYTSTSWGDTGTMLAAGGYNGVVTVWDTTKLPDVIEKVTITPYITAMPFTPHPLPQ